MLLYMDNLEHIGPGRRSLLLLKECIGKLNILTTVRPNKRISMFRVTGLKILGRVGTHFDYFFFWKKIKFYAF